MHIKISGQSSRSNYQNTGSCGGAVHYNGHDLREALGKAEEAGVTEEQMHFFNMDGQIVAAEQVVEMVDKNHAGLHKEDAKFFCLMIDPSDAEISAMGQTLTEQLANGQRYVFDVMDAYAKNFYREGVVDRHNLTAYAIAHIYKGEEQKEQLHWHVVVARKDASNKVKLSPLTNHRDTGKGVVKGGFDRKAFDFECERLFDERYGYERKVEESFSYCLAQKKGTPEQKAEQMVRLAEQNRPELETAVKAFLAQLAAEAAERASKVQRAKEEKERQETTNREQKRSASTLTDRLKKYYNQQPKFKQFSIKQGDVMGQFRRHFEEALTYNFTSFHQFEAIMAARGIIVRQGKWEDNVTDSLVFQGLTSQGNEVTKLYGEGEVGIDAMNLVREKMEANRQEHKLLRREKIRTENIAKRLFEWSTSRQHYQRMLQKKGIDVVFSRAEDNPANIIGVTFVDHSTKTAFKASELDKSVAAAEFNKAYETGHWRTEDNTSKDIDDSELITESYNNELLSDIRAALNELEKSGPSPLKNTHGNPTPKNKNEERWERERAESERERQAADIRGRRR